MINNYWTVVRQSLKLSGIAVVLGVLCQPGYADTQTLLSNADAYVRNGGLANANFGADQNLGAKYATVASGVGFDRKDYISFNIASIKPFIIEDATLTLTVSDSILGNADNANQVYSFSVYGLKNGAGDKWTEGTGTTAAPGVNGINWNNAPGNNTASGNGVTSLATSLGSFTLTGRGTPGQQIVIPGLAPFLRADSNNLTTFIITRDTRQITADDTNNVVHNFASREQGPALAPQLTVITALAPEPGALALLGVGLLGMMALPLRRKG
jgi:hypothetical protein